MNGDCRKPNTREDTLKSDPKRDDQALRAYLVALDRMTQLQLVPPNTAKIVGRLYELSKEVMTLSACVDPTKNRNTEDMRQICLLSGIDPDAPEGHWLRGGWREKDAKYISKESAKLRRHEVNRVVALGLPPKPHSSKRGTWIPDADSLKGWMLLLDRLTSAVNELASMKGKLEDLLFDVQTRAQAFDVNEPLLHSKRTQTLVESGGKPPILERVAASIMLMYLTDPNQGFEPWKPKELAELFSGYKFEGLGDVESVKNLKRQIKRSGNSYTYVSRDWVVFPAEPYCYVDVRTFCDGEYYRDENFDPNEDESPENGPWVKVINPQTDNQGLKGKVAPKEG